MNDKWNKRFLDLAQLISNWSRDPSTKVGAVLVNDFKQIVGTGFNGFCRGVPDSEEDYANRELKYKKVVHAEVNAVLNAGLAVRGATLYCTFFPCPQCAACLINAGVKKIVARENPSDERWAEEQKIAETMLVQAGVGLQRYQVDYNLKDEPNSSGAWGRATVYDTQTKMVEDIKVTYKGE